MSSQGWRIRWALRRKRQLHRLLPGYWTCLLEAFGARVQRCQTSCSESHTFVSDSQKSLWNDQRRGPDERAGAPQQIVPMGDRTGKVLCKSRGGTLEGSDIEQNVLALLLTSVFLKQNYVSKPVAAAVASLPLLYSLHRARGRVSREQ